MSAVQDRSISELPSLDAPDGADLVAVVDSSDSRTKRVTVQAIRGSAPSGSGSGGDLGDLDNVADTADAADPNDNLKVLVNDPEVAAGSRWRDVAIGGRISGSGILGLDGAGILDGTIPASKLADDVGGGASRVADLTDVNLTDIEDDQFLRRSGSAWVNSKLAVGDIPQLPASKITGLPAGSSFDPSAITESLVPASNQGVNLGSSTNRFNHLFIGGEFITRVVGFSESLTPPSIPGKMCYVNNDVVIATGSPRKIVNMSEVLTSLPDHILRADQPQRIRDVTPDSNNSTVAIDYDYDFNIFRGNNITSISGFVNQIKGKVTTVVFLPTADLDTYDLFLPLFTNDVLDHTFDFSNDTQRGRIFNASHRDGQMSHRARAFRIVADTDAHSVMMDG